MIDRVFVDTNIFVYAHAVNDKAKHDAALTLLQDRLKSERLWISVQVLSEFYATMIKSRYEHEKIVKFIREIVENINVKPLSLPTVESALHLRGKYGFSYWDSLILASALECGCILFFSEDMQHNQIVEGKLRILNPFV